jgi:hypothetical protein
MLVWWDMEGAPQIAISLLAVGHIWSGMSTLNVGINPVVKILMIPQHGSRYSVHLYIMLKPSDKPSQAIRPCSSWARKKYRTILGGGMK